MFKLGKGVTLLEITLALVLMSLLTTVFLNFNARADIKDLNRIARAIKDDIMFCQMMSMSENRKYYLKLLSETSYGIYVNSENNLEKEVKKIFLDDGVKITSFSLKNKAINFTNLGTVSAPFSMLIEKNDYTLKITGALGTGRVDIKKTIRKPNTNYN